MKTLPERLTYQVSAVPSQDDPAGAPVEVRRYEIEIDLRSLVRLLIRQAEQTQSAEASWCYGTITARRVATDTHQQEGELVPE
jgi:hypothetical protein